MKLYYLCFLAVAYFGLKSVEAITCPQLVDEVVEYFEFLKRDSYGNSFKESVRDLVVTAGINIEDRDEVQQIFCAVLDSETKSITNISASLRELHLPPTNLAFGYGMLMKSLKQNLNESVLDYEGPMKRFYDKTGFPKLPIKISKYPIAVDSMLLLEDAELASLFYPTAEYQDYYEYINMDILIPAFIEATSLEDFIQKISTYEMSEEDITSEVARYQTMYNLTISRYEKAEETVATAKALMNALTEAGFDHVTRGSPELYTCEFLSELAWETVSYALDIAGDEIQMFAAHSLPLEFSITDQDAVKSFMCTYVKVKSVAELSSFLPGLDGGSYGHFADFAMRVLLLPGKFINPALDALSLVKAAGRLGITDFPLSITKAQAMQFASMMNGMIANRDIEIDVDELADALQNAESLADFESRVTSGYTIRRPSLLFLFRQLQTVTRMIKGKEDKAVSMMVNMFAIVREEEKYGLYMLPDN